MLIDTHCHIHDKNFPLPTDFVLDEAKKAGITKIICVGVDLEDSQRAVEFANNYSSPELQIFAAIGIHPHEAKHVTNKYLQELQKLAKSPKVIAIGEIGLDYHYNHSPKSEQIKILESQLDLAKQLDIPVIFHIREAFDDFWSVLDIFLVQNNPIRGVIHSFSDSQTNLKEALKRGFYIGVNGISTFVRKQDEIDMFCSIPLERIILETDAPYLAPKGFRGKPNHPALTLEVAKHMAEQRNESIKNISSKTSQNAKSLFGF